VDVTATDDGLLVTAAEGSDLWRQTSYGFTHDSGHALLAPFPDGTALEVTFLLDYAEQFDQAGVLVRRDEHSWTKAGVEVSDGQPQVGAVVTRGVSDWSVAPVPEWTGQTVTVRASRSGDALTVRARAGDDPWRLVRVAPLDPGADLTAGPFCCAPTRAGLRVRFTRVASTPADASLHPG
jgi:regulation of enolase protein 1 (concanavalin A-like superfamily)